MEQRIWLAPWVLTEPWFSTLEALCHVVTTLEKKCDALSLRRLAGSTRCERDPKGARYHTPTF